MYRNICRREAGIFDLLNIRKFYEVIVKSRQLIFAAGGNGTAIEIIDAPLSRQEYQERGRALEAKFEPTGAEQAGFLIPSERHFEMAGGEFCGNATRSAAVLLYQHQAGTEEAFTVSGFEGVVNATVEPLTDKTFFVSASFPGMRAVAKSVCLEDSTPVKIVDLGGIVHVVIEGEFPSDTNAYSAQHRHIVEIFGLSDRGAVGVVWYEKSQDAVVMHPVVWVKAVDTFFYESSCGSGIIAVAAATGVATIVQPTGMTISAEISGSGVTLKSEMELH